MENLFGELNTQKDSLVFTYTGERFANNEMKLSHYVESVQGIEFLVNEVLKEYVRLGKITKDQSQFDIYIKIEQGSVRNIIYFIAKNQIAFQIATNVFIPFLVSATEHYLYKSQAQQTPQEIIQMLENNKNLRKGIEKTLAPIDGNENVLIINTGDGNVNLNITYSDRNTILEEIKKTNDEPIDEYVIEENIHGIVSVSKVYDTTPFNFRINGTDVDILMQFNNLEIDLEKRQEFLGKEMILDARVTYKKGKSSLIEVIDYKFIDQLF